MFYCYLIANANNTTYNGYTNNLKRRLRQHNGELCGGAKSTKNKGPWNYVFIITKPDWTKNEAMSLEWHIRYPTNKKPRPREYKGVNGRINSLTLLMKDEYELYILDEYINLYNNSKSLSNIIL